MVERWTENPYVGGSIPPRGTTRTGGTAGVAQLAEQLICNQQVVGSIPITSSTLPRFDGVKFHMGGLQSGQMHQTVNLTSPTSVVRIHLLPPAKKTSLCLSFLLRASSVSNHRSTERSEGLPRVPLTGNGNTHLLPYIITLN